MLKSREPTHLQPFNNDKATPYSKKLVSQYKHCVRGPSGYRVRKGPHTCFCSFNKRTDIILLSIVRLL